MTLYDFMGLLYVIICDYMWLYIYMCGYTLTIIDDPMCLGNMDE